MIDISISAEAGEFAENKDIAAYLREDVIKPALRRKGEKIRFNFSGVDLTTQSFVHALISEALRIHGEDVLKRLEFKSCNKGVRGIIETVVQYSLDTSDESDNDDK